MDKNKWLCIGVSALLIFLMAATIAFVISTKNPSETKTPAFKKPTTIPATEVYAKPTLPPLTLDSIFKPDNNLLNQLLPNQTLTIITTGDVIPARMVNVRMTEYNDFTRPLAKTADFLRTADLTLINLEAPLVKDCPVTMVGMVFCGSEQFVQGLKLADIDAVNIANNHSLNWNEEGLDQTVQLLNNNGMVISGGPTGRLTTKTVKGQTIGFLGWDLLSAYDENSLLAAVGEADPKTDQLIISLHWGTEYTYYPENWQRQLAHRLVDKGADLIVGNHPHWIQPIEIYKNKVIIYAHGNFIFDQEWSPETKIGFIGRHTFFQDKEVSLQLLPIRISDYHQPSFLEGEEKVQVLSKLEQISLSFSAK
jgi:poly-gamma-glutamate synthesis protein (capsule biosynthesis protein)